MRIIAHRCAEQMRWVAAPWVVASMGNDFSIWYWAIRESPRNLVCFQVYSATRRHATIPEWMCRLCNPWPTVVIKALGNFCQNLCSKLARRSGSFMMFVNGVIADVYHTVAIHQGK